MKNLALLGVLLALAGCGSEPTESEVVEIVPKESVTEVKEVVPESAESLETVNKQDAENYVMMVKTAIDDAKAFDPITDVDDFKDMLKRFTELRDDGNNFLESEFYNCGKLGMFPLDILWMRKGKEGIEEKIQSYEQFYQSCQQQINTTN